MNHPHELCGYLAMKWYRSWRCSMIHLSNNSLRGVFEIAFITDAGHCSKEYP
jgi:hypothetical protein